MTLEMFTNIEFLRSFALIYFSSTSTINCLPKSEHKIHLKTEIFHEIFAEISEPMFLNFEQIFCSNGLVYQNQLVIISFIK